MHRRKVNEITFLWFKIFGYIHDICRGHCDHYGCGCYGDDDNVDSDDSDDNRDSNHLDQILLHDIHIQEILVDGDFDYDFQNT